QTSRPDAKSWPPLRCGSPHSARLDRLPGSRGLARWRRSLAWANHSPPSRVLGGERSVGSKMADRYDGFRDFFAARRSDLTRTAFFLTGDDNAAEDLLQEAMVKTAAKWHRIHPSG